MTAPFDDEQLPPAARGDESDPDAPVRGERHGCLVVVRAYQGVTHRPGGALLCRCDCGRAHVAYRALLRSGHVWCCTQCRLLARGPKRRLWPPPPAPAVAGRRPDARDETGREYGRLEVLGPYGALRPRGGVAWLCACTGPTHGLRLVVISGTDLRRGNTLSCGCMRLERQLTNLDGQNARRSRERDPQGKRAREAARTALLRWLCSPVFP